MLRAPLFIFFFFFPAEIIHLYLYLAVVWMSSVDTLCLVYTSSQQFPDLDAGPMVLIDYY